MGRISLHNHLDAIISWSGILFFMVAIIAVIAAYIWYIERRRVYNMPKKEMMICDEHGAYPKEASCYIIVPEEGKKDLRVEICPLCMHNRHKKMEQDLNRMKKDSK